MDQSVTCHRRKPREPGGLPPRAPRTRRGAAAAELALILPLLITLVLACIDFGRFGSTYIAITNAARAGAAVGSNNQVTTTTLPQWRARITAAAQNEFSGQSGADVNCLTIATPELLYDSGSPLRRVRVRANYQFQMIVPWPLLPNQISMSRTVEMRMIY